MPISEYPTIHPKGSRYLNDARQRNTTALSGTRECIDLPRSFQPAITEDFRTSAISSRIRCLSPYRNAGLNIQRAKLISANALRGGRDYQFHPDGIRSLEIRSLGRLAQGVDAVLLLPGGRVGETRQLEHDP